jgi:hypothetical protein
MILDVPADADDAVVHSAWRAAMSSAHPDRARARGLPLEFIEVAEAKSAAINAAFSTVMRERRDMGLARRLGWRLLRHASVWEKWAFQIDHAGVELTFSLREPTLLTIRTELRR